MCGISGILSLRDSRAATKLMTDAIRHRGPDDVGLGELRGPQQTVHGMFGHRRLAIIDLSSAGHQPMFTADGRLAITFNGEIYNYAELKRELEREGAVFRSSCDTEVLLVGWLRHGADFLSRLRGMFAFALWDSELDRGYLVRDAFGIKPLYVAERDGEVLFASEVRALLASGRIRPALSAPAVASYLSTGSVAEPLTIIEGMVAVPPGCVVEVALGNAGFRTVGARRFARAYPPEPDIHRDPRSHIHRVRNALRESVRYHLVSDVPVALFLSGGIDSSAVAGLASEVSDSQLESFTVTFSEADFSEAAPAREAARRFNTRHHEILLSGDDLLSALPDVFAAMDQPSLDGLNTFVVSRAVRSYGIKVVLSGLGGDELFGGYPSFRRARYIAPLWKLPRPVRHVGAMGVSRFADLRADRVHTLLDESSPAYAAYRGSRTLFSARQLASLTAGPSRQSPVPRPDDADVDALTLTQQVSLYELTGYMRNTLLRDSDVFSMAHALELRVPLVDIGVARAAGSAADAFGARNGMPKPVLVESVRDLLSQETIDRPKRGFTLPFETWMRRELFDEVNSVLTGVRADGIGLRRTAVADVWDQFQRRRPGVNWSRPWALYTLLRWAAQNGLAEVAVTDALPAHVSLAAAG
ncbi:MAG: asparagine synthase (glutamine-hydrolyzing) [Gemmatimonadales bacterium]